MKKAEHFSMVAKTFAGLEEVLSSELTALGATDVKILKRAVAFSGDTRLMYTANYALRTALRVLKPIANFRVDHPAGLYRKVSEIDWYQIFNLHRTFTIDAFSTGDYFKNSHFVAQKTKDAIVDQFRDKYGQRPDVGKQEADVWINVHITDTECIISLDSSGESLHRRGYRKSQHQAPLNEVLAAGLIKLAGWDSQSILVDPMCGSGTILTEAAMMSRNIAPGYFRKEFSFFNWKDFDSTLWEDIKSNWQVTHFSGKAKLFGSDISEENIAMAQENALLAGLKRDIRFKVKDFNDLETVKGPGMVITNPPYGERLESEDLKGLYSQFGDVLKNRFQGFEAWMISSDLEALKFVGLHPSKKILVFNGPLECRFVKFELY